MPCIIAYKKLIVFEMLVETAVGCPDVIETPAITSSRREGNTLILRCANSAVTYHLVCLPNTNQWRGNVAACNEIDG
jgi:hypothetical protein